MFKDYYSCHKHFDLWKCFRVVVTFPIRFIKIFKKIIYNIIYSQKSRFLFKKQNIVSPQDMSYPPIKKNCQGFKYIISFKNSKNHNSNKLTDRYSSIGLSMLVVSPSIYNNIIIYYHHYNTKRLYYNIIIFDAPAKWASFRPTVVQIAILLLLYNNIIGTHRIIITGPLIGRWVVGGEGRRKNPKTNECQCT